MYLHKHNIYLICLGGGDNFHRASGLITSKFPNSCRSKICWHYLGRLRDLGTIHTLHTKTTHPVAGIWPSSHATSSIDLCMVCNIQKKNQSSEVSCHNWPRNQRSLQCMDPLALVFPAKQHICSPSLSSAVQLPSSDFQLPSSAVPIVNCHSAGLNSVMSDGMKRMVQIRTPPTLRLC